MGANPAQAKALILFLAAFICIAGGFAGNLNWLLMIVGLALLGASAVFFLKNKSGEYREE